MSACALSLARRRAFQTRSIAATSAYFERAASRAARGTLCDKPIRPVVVQATWASQVRRRKGGRGWVEGGTWTSDYLTACITVWILLATEPAENNF